MSKCEMAILCLLVQGLTTKQIAQRLAKSTKTVETQRTHLLRTMQCKNAMQLAYRAGKEGLC